MEKPLVTLLLPCYNCEKTLDRFMRSVISEPYRPLELICIDDGSTDDTAKLLKTFESILKESGVVTDVLSSCSKLVYLDQAMCQTPGYGARVFSALANHGIEPLIITTSVTDISVLVEHEDLAAARQALEEV